MYNAKMNREPDGLWVIKLGESYYGDAALKRDGAAYYELRRQEETAGPKVVTTRGGQGGRRRQPRS